MLLTTIQEANHFDGVYNRYLTTDFPPSFSGGLDKRPICLDITEPTFVHNTERAYNWLRDYMGYGPYPIWAWDAESEAAKKKLSGWGQKPGTPMVALTFEKMDDCYVKWISFQAWHMILSGFAILGKEDERCIQWDENPAFVLKTWPRVFDAQWLIDNEYILGETQDDSQYIVERIYFARELKKREYFPAPELDKSED